MRNIIIEITSSPYQNIFYVNIHIYKYFHDLTKIFSKTS